ncbi:MAG TPA: VWA domain-containing protein [Bryobacteraceae bacterium]|nr:VWA domain-containing protein [Bryobacteraceae bacterium]
MPWTRAAALSVCFWLCSTAIAFQRPSDDTAVSIVPRVRMDAPDAPVLPRTRLRVDSALVQIPVHVTTPAGASVTGLTRENFQLFEDNVQQKIAHFAMEDAPISIGLLFDASGSMHNKMQQSSEAAANFFKTANADDEFFLVEFNDRPKLTVPFTPDSGELYQRILHTRPFGRTSLLDAIHLALVHMKNARNLRKAIVILSDGGDNRSRYTAREIKNAMLESDVQLYAMGIFDPDESRKRTPEEQNGPQLLEELAEQSGGRLYTVDHLDDLPAISARIGNELRNQYVLGYFSTNDTRDGKYRRVKVQLLAPPQQDLRIHHRPGYHAPAE